MKDKKHGYILVLCFMVVFWGMIVQGNGACECNTSSFPSNTLLGLDAGAYFSSGVLNTFLGSEASYSYSNGNLEKSVRGKRGLKKRFVIKVDGDEREFFVHVPSGYDKNRPTPVVFMLHGASGNGEKYYRISGWKELGERETILTVFPTSWRYRVIKKKKKENTTRWNVYPGLFEFCPGERPRDDIKFLRKVFSELNRMYNVNKKMVYIVGFSNGGCMAFRCGVEMSDIFAAIVQSGGTYSGDNVFTPVKNIPVTFQLGNKDGAWFGKAGGTVPMSQFKELLNQLPIFQRLIKAHTKTFSFETSYRISGDENIALLAKFKGEPDNGKRSFNFIFVKGLQHEYPNGRNHPIYGAKKNWSWLKQFTLE